MLLIKRCKYCTTNQARDNKLLRIVKYTKPNAWDYPSQKANIVSKCIIYNWWLLVFSLVSSSLSSSGNSNEMNLGHLFIYIKLMYSYGCTYIKIEPNFLKFPINLFRATYSKIKTFWDFVFKLQGYFLYSAHWYFATAKKVTL